MKTSNDVANTPITRVRKIKIANFRGFMGKHESIDTDADIVLLSGPNGYGKTSFLDALLLLLTGHHYYKDPVVDLIALSGQQKDEATEKRSSQRITCDLEAEVKYGTDEIEQIRLQWDSKGMMSIPAKQTLDKARFPRPQGLPTSRLGDDSELEARLCGFFQDRVDRLFDETTGGKTLRDILDPPRKPLLELEKRLPELAEELKKASDEVEHQRWNGRPAEELAQNLAQAFADFRLHYRELRRPDDPNDKWPDPPNELVGEATLIDFSLKLLASEGVTIRPDNPGLPDKLRDRIQERIKRQLREARKKGVEATAETEELEHQIREVEDGIENIGKQYSALERELRAFDPDPFWPGDVDALTVFRTLEHNAALWSRLELSPADARVGRLMRVLEELQAVVGQEAGKCAEALESWLEPRRQAHQRLLKLKREKQVLEEKLQTSLRSKEIERLLILQSELNRALEELIKVWNKERDRLNWERLADARKREAAFLKDASEAVEKCKLAVERVTQPNRQLMEELCKLVDGVLHRFSLVEGIRPIRLKGDPEVSQDIQDQEAASIRRVYRIETADGRGLSHLSTGQRAQTAVSLLVAQNLAVSDLLSHQIILLDDVTTAYDLSNLTREAILWRQLAYGALGGEITQRQVFISSHHEDLTSHLLDLLVPPGKRKMRMLRFDAWSPETGPVVKTFEIVSTKAAGTQKDPTEARRDFSLAINNRNRELLRWRA